MMFKLITECIYFSRSNFWSFFKIFGPYVIITSLLAPFVEVLAFSLRASWLNLTYLVLVSFAYTYLMVRFIKLMAYIASGYPEKQTVSFSEWWSLLVVYFFYGIAVLVGVLALILPGLFLAARYGFADFEVILNGKPAFAALNESWKDTKPITIRLMLVLVVLGGSQFALEFLFGLVGDVLPEIHMVVEILSGLISTSFMIFMSVVLFRLYTENRSAENVSLQEKA